MAKGKIRTRLTVSTVATTIPTLTSSEKPWPRVRDDREIRSNTSGVALHVCPCCAFTRPTDVTARGSSVNPLGNRPIVESKHPAESFNASNWAEIRPGAIAGFDESVAETLMVSLRVIMSGVLDDCLPERRLTEEDYLVEALVFDRPDKSFGIGIQVRRSWRQADDLDAGTAQEISESRREFAVTV